GVVFKTPVRSTNEENSCAVRGVPRPAGLLVFAHPSIANDLTGAKATVDCNGFALSVDAHLLTVGQPFTINFTFTLTPVSSPPITVPGTITFTGSVVTETLTKSGTWPGA